MRHRVETLWHLPGLINKRRFHKDGIYLNFLEQDRDGWTWGKVELIRPYRSDAPRRPNYYGVVFTPIYWSHSRRLLKIAKHLFNFSYHTVANAEKGRPPQCGIYGNLLRQKTVKARPPNFPIHCQSQLTVRSRCERVAIWHLSAFSADTAIEVRKFLGALQRTCITEWYLRGFNGSEGQLLKDSKASYSHPNQCATGSPQKQIRPCPYPTGKG